MLNDKAKLIRTNKLGVDSRVDEILQNPESPLAVLYRKTELLSKNSLKKSYIESSLLCSDDLEKISKILEVSVETLTVYREFFFDTEGFDRLSKIEHIEGVKDKNEMLLKMWALSHGLDFISWRLGYRVTISPVEGLADLFSTCIYKSKEAMFNSSSSDASKEGTKWAKISTDIARLLKLWVMDSSAAKKDLEIAIREVVPEFEGLDKILESNGVSMDEIKLATQEIDFASISELNGNQD